MRALVFTRKVDGGVTVTSPTPETLATMRGRGGYWDGHPKGFLDELVTRKSCPELQRGMNLTEDDAWRFVKAMQFGGLSEFEAWENIKAHDCSRYGYLIEIQDTAEHPDRWFRDAWVRGRNGGPISVDLAKAKPIQYARIVDSVTKENSRRARDLYGKRAVKLDELSLKSAIKNAAHEDALRRIWPDEIERPKPEQSAGTSRLPINNLRARPIALRDNLRGSR